MLAKGGFDRWNHHSDAWITARRTTGRSPVDPGPALTAERDRSAAQIAKPLLARSGARRVPTHLAGAWIGLASALINLELAWSSSCREDQIRRSMPPLLKERRG
jgi:hypothetical protein